MAAVDNPIGLSLEQHHAFAEKVASHVTFIINTVRTHGVSPKGHRVEEEGIGVGSACAWGQKKFILTAKHVLERANPGDLRFFFRHAGQIDWNARPIQQSLAIAVALKIEKIVRFEADDLACILLSEPPNAPVEFAIAPGAFGKVPPAGGGTPSSTELPRTKTSQSAPSEATRRCKWVLPRNRADVGPWSKVKFHASFHHRSIPIDIFYLSTTPPKKAPGRMALVAPASGIKALSRQGCGRQGRFWRGSKPSGTDRVKQ